MADDKEDSLRDEAIGNGEGLLQFSAVVGGDDDELLPQHAAGGVNVGRGLVRAVAQFRAEDGIGAAERSGKPDAYFAESWRGT